MLPSLGMQGIATSGLQMRCKANARPRTSVSSRQHRPPRFQRMACEVTCGEQGAFRAPQHSTFERRGASKVRDFDAVMRCSRRSRVLVGPPPLVAQNREWRAGCDEFAPNRSTMCRIWHTLLLVGPFKDNFAESRAESVVGVAQFLVGLSTQIWPIAGQVRARFADSGPKSAELAPSLADSGTRLAPSLEPD